MRSASIGVLTFHRCINYGSYWQARCLVEGLRSRGHDAVLLDHRSTRIDWAEWRCALRPAPGTWGEWEDRNAYAAKARRFFAAFEQLPMSRPFGLDDPEAAPPVELALVGSDEVWNLHHPWYGGAELFYGEGLRAGRRASYAASFGNQSATGSLESRWIERLRSFDAISVRDANSRDIVHQVTEREPALVLDPVLQFPGFIDAAPVERQGGYVALYGHGFPDWLQHQVRAWADHTGHRIISIGYRNWWADDHWIEAGPAEFAGFVAGADAVVTNFFHGCVFALVNGKPFVTAPSDYRSNKIRDLTATLGAQAHLVSEGTAEPHFDRMLALPLDPAIAASIAALRLESEAYLDAVLR